MVIVRQIMAGGDTKSKKYTRALKLNQICKLLELKEKIIKCAW